MAADAPHPSFERFASESVPQSNVGAPGKDGQLELVFGMTDDGTRLVYDFARVPFHVTGDLDDDPHPQGSVVCVQSPSGGIVQGDRQTIEITARPDAIAYVGTQSATKVQTMEYNYAATDVTLSVESGGHLDYVPEPTILHADARYHRKCRLTVGEDATAILGDVLVPGRIGRDEWFEFDRYYSTIECVGPDGLLFADSEHHHPDDDQRAPGVLGEHDVYGTLYVVVPDAEADELHDMVSEAAGPETRAGASTLPNDAGVMVRAVGPRADAVTDTLRAAWESARRTAVGAPPPPGRVR
jgi:urease accessory protein